MAIDRIGMLWSQAYPIDDVVPLDVDTWDDYRRLLATAVR